MRRPLEVMIVVRRGEEFLVLHRSPRGGAYWHVVAGALEDGETWAEAAARELLEETGLAADPVEVSQPFAYSIDEDPSYVHRLPPGTLEIAVHPFLVDAPAGWEPRLDHEHDGYRWCARDEAVGLLRWPEPRAIVASLA